jgi:tRNA-specific 2-thiouridylase
MLARLDPRLLERVRFPLGEQDKEATRAEAARAGLAVASRTESQEACFLGGDDYRRFLERQGVGGGEGPVVDEDGRELGRHAGFWRFTPGQRRGLGVSSDRPLYALRTEPRTSTVVVGPRPALAVETISARGRLYVKVEKADVKWRYRSPAVPGRIVETEHGFQARLDRPAYGVAPGQAAVLYEGAVVVGAGALDA